MMLACEQRGEVYSWADMMIQPLRYECLREPIVFGVIDAWCFLCRYHAAEL